MEVLGMEPSVAMQEYLAEAYRIHYYQTDDQYISTSALADTMHVSAPAVTRMVQRLKEADFLDHAQRGSERPGTRSRHEASRTGALTSRPSTCLSS